MPDLWLTCDHFVGSFRYGSTNQANSAFHPSGVGNWVVIHVIPMDYGGGDHQTADQRCIWLFGCSLKSVGLDYNLRCTPTLWQKHRCSCTIRLLVLYKWYWVHCISTYRGGVIKSPNNYAKSAIHPCFCEWSKFNCAPLEHSLCQPLHSQAVGVNRNGAGKNTELGVTYPNQTQKKLNLSLVMPYLLLMQLLSTYIP